MQDYKIESACLSPAFADDEPRVYDDFYSSAPRLKCVYVTPEKVARSDKLVRALDSLNRRGFLARVVIDEAHCISSWGHDFRLDYKGLSVFKQRFPAVPIMALTATATERVQQDIVAQLRVPNAARFIQVRG